MSRSSAVVSAAMTAGVVLTLALPTNSDDRRPGPLADDDELLTKVTDNQLAVLLDLLKVKAERGHPGRFRVEHSGRTIWLTNYGVDCLLFCGFETGGRGTLGSVNRWNAGDAGATRAYIDEDGDPCLEMDVDVEGGISPFALSLDIQHFLNAVDRFVHEVVRGNAPRNADGP